MYFILVIFTMLFFVFFFVRGILYFEFVSNQRNTRWPIDTKTEDGRWWNGGIGMVQVRRKKEEEGEEDGATRTSFATRAITS